MNNSRSPRSPQSQKNNDGRRGSGRGEGSEGKIGVGIDVLPTVQGEKRGMRFAFGSSFIYSADFCKSADSPEP